MLLAAWSLAPVGLWWAGGDPALYAGAWQTWMWGMLVAGLLAAVAWILSKGRAAPRLFAAWRVVVSWPARGYLAALAALLVLLTVLVCAVVFSGNPRNVDGFAYLFQARMILAGRAWLPPPAELANFGILQMILGPDRWYAQYPPGQSVVLAAGLALGTWWLLNPLIAVGFALATYRVACWCAGESVARLAALLAVVSPFVLAMAGSEMSHLAAATLGIASAAAAVMSAERDPHGWAWAAAAGVGLGLMTAFRPLDAVAAAVPVAIITMLGRTRRAESLAVMAAAGGMATVPTLAWNAATTGSWTTFGYVALWGRDHSLGFHQVPWGVPLNFTRAVGLTGLDLLHLNTYTFDLPVPILLVIATGMMVGWRSLGSRDVVPVAGALVLSGLLFFFWHRDVFYGPRFLFSAVPWYLVLTARSLVLLRRSGSPGAAGAFGVVVAFVTGLVMIAPGRFRAFREGAPALALHPDRDARQAGLAHALVVIPDGWGTRLIARMWEAGVPVSRSSRLYSAIDACTLERVLDTERSGPPLVATLDTLAARARPGVAVSVTDDPNLRLLPGDTLPVACIDEINFDRRHGILAFAPFLYLNSAGLDGSIVWARDLGARNGALFARYPDRPVFRYVIEGGTPHFSAIARP